MIAENPALTRSLQNAQSPEEANALMAGAWKFAGWNQPGGENAARLATTQDYAGRLANGMQLPASAGGSSASGRFGLAGPTQSQAPTGPAPAQAPPAADGKDDDDTAKLMQAFGSEEAGGATGAEAR